MTQAAQIDTVLRTAIDRGLQWSTPPVQPWPCQPPESALLTKIGERKFCHTSCVRILAVLGIVSASGLDITGNGTIVTTLIPRRDSKPDFLAVAAPILAPGHQLHGHVKSSPDGDLSGGFIALTVAR